MANETLKDCLFECTNEAMEAASIISPFFGLAGRGYWSTPLEEYKERPYWDPTYGMGALGLLKWLHRKNYQFRRPDDQQWDSVFFAIDWFNSSRTEHIELFGTSAASWHELTLEVASMIVHSIWRTLGGKERFGKLSHEDWISLVEQDELARTIQRLMFCGKWGGRPHHHAVTLVSRLSEEYSRALTMLLTLEGAYGPGSQEEPVTRIKKPRFPGASCPNCGVRAKVTSSPGKTRYLACPQCGHTFKKTMDAS